MPGARQFSCSTTEYYKEMFRNAPEIPISKHPNIRSAAACYSSSQLAIRMASLAGARLHVLHVSTAKELQLFSDAPLEDKHIRLELTDSAKNYLIDNGYDEIYGARPLKRFVQKKLETLIAKKILTQEILPNSLVTIDCVENELCLVK